MLTADAGSGKSSVVGDLVLRCPPGQAPGADREALPDALQRRHVVRINLKGLNGVEIPPEPDTAGPIWQLLRQELAAASHPDASVSLDDPAAIGACDLLRQQLGAGGLLLLDALDEVIDAEQRARARRLIVRLAAELPPACALLVTARPYAFDDGSLPGFLGPWSLRPLSIRGEDPQVRQLIRRWLTALAEAPGGEQAAGEALYRDLASDPMRAEMAEIPLLLTLFIGVAHSRGEDGHRDPLPRDRAALLEETMALVLERWLYRIRDAVGDAIPPELTPDKLRRALQLMSLRALREQPAHQRRRASTGILVTANVFDKAVQDALGRDLIAKLYDARDTLRYRAGVLRRLGVGEEEPYEFIHRQFQEYLAGLELVQRHVAGDGADDLAAVLAAELEADPGVWREVARFALVILARHKGAPQALDVAARLLAAPHATEAVSPARWEALGVAAVALADVQDAMASASARSGEAARGARSGLDAW